MKKVGLGILMSSFLALSLTGYGQNSASAATVTKKTITFFTDMMSDQMKDAGKKYEALHPDVTINFQFSQASSKLVNANKEMLAGKGPDMLLVGSSPIEKYVKQSLLVDLGTMMSKDSTFKKQDYFSNILDNVKDSKGRLYSMPLGFGLTGLLGDADAIAKTGVTFDDKQWTLNDFMKTGTQLKAAKGKYTYMSESDLTTRLLMNNPSLVIDTTGNKVRSDSTALKNLLNQGKSMLDNGIVAPQGDPILDNGGIIPQRAYFLDVGNSSTAWDYMESVNFLGKKSEFNATFYNYPRLDGVSAGGYFTPQWNVSLNANSKLKQEAWDFLKFMLSEEGQNSGRTDFIPLNKQGFTKQLNKLKADGSFKALHMSVGDGKPVPVDKTKLDKWVSLVNGATHKNSEAPFWPIPSKDPSMQLSVGIETNSYYTGVKTLDAAIKGIQNVLTTYFKQYP